MEEKEVGKIKDDKATFLQVIYSVNIITGEMELDIKKDTRLLKDTNDTKLEEIVFCTKNI